MESKIHLPITREQYYDKVFACWLGKNAGGTLGEPLEKLFGQDELFDVWWYPRILPGGMPNDDLEVQLVNLQALKDRGLSITATDLAEYWLKGIWYNYDEYGLHKTNLRKGLQPPLSGWYNNWFKNCMGCPIRSELWATIAPGLPFLAAQYAYQDAIVDHAGGESVYGEIFNTVMQSCAFILSDFNQIVELGLKAIPETSKTALAIRTAIQAKQDGLDWKAARNKVKDAIYSPIAQYSPINMGYEIIGLLYGTDFADAICKAVNCGWDTDCTGATVGALYGIIHGSAGIPKKWQEPLGDAVIAREKWIKNIQAPQNLHQLTEQCVKLGEFLLEREKIEFIQNSTASSNLSQFSVEQLKQQISKIISNLNQVPNQMTYFMENSEIQVIYPETPALIPDKWFTLEIIVKNKTDQPQEIKLDLQLPTAWEFQPNNEVQNTIFANQEFKWTIQVKAQTSAILTTQSLILTLHNISKKTSKTFQIPVLAASAWFVSDVIPSPHKLKQKSPWEKAKKQKKPLKNWHLTYFKENALEIEPLFQKQSGFLYLIHYINSPNKRNVCIGVPNTSLMQLWVNGKHLVDSKKIIPLRPNYGGDGVHYRKHVLKKGWNQIMIKIQRDNIPVEAHFVISHRDDNRGMEDIVEHQYPWLDTSLK